MLGSKPQSNEVAKRITGLHLRMFSGVALVSILLLGCNSQPSGSEVTGSVSFKGKPVYPAVVMLKGASGKSYTAKLTEEGGFRVFGVEPDKYQVAIETIKLGTKPAPRSDASAAAKDESGFPTRELTPPDQYKNANINIPKKYNSFDTSELEIDCSDGYPESPVELVLGK